MEQHGMEGQERVDFFKLYQEQKHRLRTYKRRVFFLFIIALFLSYLVFSPTKDDSHKEAKLSPPPKGHLRLSLLVSSRLGTSFHSNRPVSLLDSKGSVIAPKAYLIQLKSKDGFLSPLSVATIDIPLDLIQKVIACEKREPQGLLLTASFENTKRPLKRKGLPREILY